MQWNVAKADFVMRNNTSNVLENENTDNVKNTETAGQGKREKEDNKAAVDVGRRDK